jgi:hypothetical protein
MEAKYRRISFATFALSVLVSVAFSYIVFPRLRAPLDLNPDPEGMSRLAENISQGVGYVWDSTHPDVPALDRGPIYPWILAIFRIVLGKDFLWGVQLFQGICLGLTGLVIFVAAKKLLPLPNAFVVQVLSSFHPVLVWYSARIWIETLHGLLIAILVLGLVAFFERPSTTRSVLTGVLIGLCALTKSILLLFPIPLTVLLVMSFKRQGVFYALVLSLAMVVVVSPWTMRNYLVSGFLVPVHTSLGLNLFIGDRVAENMLVPPNACVKYSDEGWNKVRAVLDGTSLDPIGPAGDRVLTESFFRGVVGSPILVIRHIAVNLVTFWYLGESTLKCWVMGLFLLPAIIVALLRTRRIWTEESTTRPVLLMVAFYWLAHGMIVGFGRYATPLVPSLMLLVVMGILPHSMRNDQRGEE